MCVMEWYVKFGSGLTLAGGRLCDEIYWGMNITIVRQLLGLIAQLKFAHRQHNDLFFLTMKDLVNVTIRTST